MVTRRILQGEMYQFPVMELIGTFLSKNRSPVFLREVCKKTDEMLRSEDVVWRRLLSERCDREGGALRSETKRITGAYERWLVHTAMVKSKMEKKVYWPSVTTQLRWHRMRKDICILRAKREFVINTKPEDGSTHHKISTLTHQILSLQDKMKETVSGGHKHHRRKTMMDMLESGKILRHNILPLVSSLVESSKPAKKPRKKPTLV